MTSTPHGSRPTGAAAPSDGPARSAESASSGDPARPAGPAPSGEPGRPRESTSTLDPVPSEREHRIDALTMVLALVLAVFFLLTAWEVSTLVLRVAAFGVVLLWAAEMVLGSLTDQYRQAGPRAIRFATVALSVSQIAACALTFVTGSALLPVAIAGVVRLVRRPERSTAVMAVVLAADALALASSALASGAKPELLIIFVLVLGGAALIGRFRAQRVRAADRERVLLREQIAVQRERAENAALVERARIARDLHDVLAHSLGALTLQLDAAVALVEAGRFDDVETRLRRARGLAADGLAESRDVVSALREMPREVITGIEDAAAAHRDNDGEVHLEGLLAAEPLEAGTVGSSDRGACREALRSLEPARSDALLRAAQEMLTNVRRHAPGRVATLDLEAHDGRAVLRCTVRAADGDGDGVGTTSADLIGQGPRKGSPGGGYGLLAMRERCEAVGGAASARLLAGGIVETTASVPLSPAEPVVPASATRPPAPASATRPPAPAPGDATPSTGPSADAGPDHAEERR